MNRRWRTCPVVQNVSRETFEPSTAPALYTSFNVRSAPLIFLSAGEASGDHYGAELITALREVLPDARFTGLGGTQMEAAGQTRVIRAEDVAVMGITEILRHIPRILRSYRTLVRSIKGNRPDVAILIDFPDVNFRLAKHLKRLGVPVLWFVSPQLWAWKRRRLRWVQQRVAKMLTIFPFEQTFYANRGVEAEFIGHPLAEQPLPTISREGYAEAAKDIHQDQWNYGDAELGPWAYWRGDDGIRYALDTSKPWVALLPGSRCSEIWKNLWPIVEAAKLLGPAYEYLVPVAPGLSEKQLLAIQYNTGDGQLSGVPDLPRITFVRDARAALLHSRAAVVASGTATVQAAVIGTPLVVVYKVSKLTFAAAKRLVRYPVEIPAQEDEYGNLPIAMVNLIAGKRIVPELLQDQFTADNIVKHLKPLLADTPERKAQIEALAEVRERLQSPTGQPSIQRLRDAVLIALNLLPGSVSGANTPASNE